MINIKRKYSTGPKYCTIGFKHGGKIFLTTHTVKNTISYNSVFFVFQIGALLTKLEGKTSQIKSATILLKEDATGKFVTSPGTCFGTFVMSSNTRDLNFGMANKKNFRAVRS